MKKKSYLKDSLLLLMFDQGKDYFPYYFFALTSLLLTQIGQSYMPFYAKELSEILSSSALEKNVPYLKYFLCALGIIVFRTLSRYLFFYPARMQEKHLKMELIERLEYTNPKKYKSFNSGQLFQILQNDLAQVRALFGFAFLQMGNIIIALSVLVPKLYNFHAELLITFIPMFGCVIIFSIYIGMIQGKWKQGQAEQGDVQNFLIESYHGKQSIQNFGAQNSFADTFKTLSFKELTTMYKAGIGLSWAMPMIRLGISATLVWGFIIIRQKNLGAADLIVFSGFVFLLNEPIMFLTWIGAVFARALASWKRIIEFKHHLDKVDPTKYVIAQDKKDQFTLELKFWDKDLQLPVFKNRWNLLIGETGCGKSTILQQIADSFNQNGITVNLVNQAPYLYNDTMIKNLFLGLEVNESDKLRAKKYINLFMLNSLEHNFNALLNLEIGENGKKVSGGQAKRIALVRSLLMNSEVIIWDDPFSSIDMILEKEIMEELLKDEALKNRTFIICGHRYSILKYVGNILLLDQEVGIKENLTPQELNTRENGIYEFFEKQMV